MLSRREELQHKKTRRDVEFVQEKLRCEQELMAASAQGDQGRVAELQTEIDRINEEIDVVSESIGMIHEQVCVCV